MKINLSFLTILTTVTFYSNYLSISAHFIFADFLSLVYLVIKIYRMLCFCKLTLDQLPLLNPYIWPLSVVRILTAPYFQFVRTLIPTLRFGRYSYNASILLALEFLLAVLAFIIRLRFLVLSHVETLMLS